MPEILSADEFVTALQQVIDGKFGGKPFFFWQGDVAKLKAVMSLLPNAGSANAWLDVRDLAEDVIPRRARDVLRSKLQETLRKSSESGVKVLVVENPWLLIRYEPAAPLAAFWNGFVNSERAVVVVVPPVMPRPAGLPEFVRYQDDVSAQLFAAATGCQVVDFSGGVPA